MKLKYLILTAALIFLSLSYAGYYLYMWDKKPVDEKLADKKAVKNIPPKNNITKNIPEHLTRRFWENISPELLKEKLKNIKNINQIREDNKQNMLHLLVRYGKDPEMISLLISAGLNYRLKDNTRWSRKPGYSKKTALHYAVSRGEKAYEFTKELLKYYTDISLDETGVFVVGNKPPLTRTPLMTAVYQRQSIRLIRLLLDKGADPNFSGNNPALILASKPHPVLRRSFINPEVVQLLLDHKADLTKKDFLGKTAYDYMKNNPDFIKTDLFKKISLKLGKKSL